MVALNANNNEGKPHGATRKSAILIMAIVFAAAVLALANAEAKPGKAPTTQPPAQMTDQCPPNPPPPSGEDTNPAGGTN